MPVSEFIDSNVWLYALMQTNDAVRGDKRQRARALLAGLERPVINSQVVREVCSNMLKKAAEPEAGLLRLITDLYLKCEIHPSTEAQHLLASQLRQSASFSYWDSLIVAAALDAGCTTLFSEDMQHGRVIEGRLTIVNPLRD
jgi:predicted nucleic acid-binding protein